VPIRHEIEAVVLGLKPGPVAESPDEMTQMQLAGRPHPGDHAPAAVFLPRSAL
jgi:hypothetical protein